MVPRLLCLADIHKFSINPLLCFQRSLDVLEVTVGRICVADTVSYTHLEIAGIPMPSFVN